MSAAAVTVRPATAGDAAALAGLLTELGYPQTADELAPRLRRLGEVPTLETVVAECGGAVVGAATLHRLPLLHDAGWLGRISSMIVTGSHRGRGVGRALVDRLERRAAAAGCVRMEVTSRLRRREAHAFYEHLGYAHASKRFVKPLPAP
ncbi:MAG: GNAT family N-acetyltransferase [Planctomycetota bacterium]